MTRKEFYVVYSVRTKMGSGFGRDTVTCDVGIDTMDRIKQIEEVLLKAAREKDPDAGYEGLFLMDWRELVPRT